MANELLDRWKAETPAFFKKIIVAGLGIGAVGALVLSLPLEIPTLVLPPIVTTVAGYAVAIGTVAAGIAKITKVDTTPPVTQS